MYRYYADVAPAAARVPPLPPAAAGRRSQGWTRADAAGARATAACCRAKPTISSTSFISGTSARRRARSSCSATLRQRYPGNPLFPLQIADIQDTYLHDVSGQPRDLSNAADAGAERHGSTRRLMAEVRARLGIARHLETLAETDEAIEQLQRVVALKPAAPYSALAVAYLRLGEALRPGKRPKRRRWPRTERAALAAPPDDRHNVRRDAAERLRKTPNAAHAEAYRLSLDGLRQLEQKDLTAARFALERSIALNPRDPIAHYRYGRVLAAQREHGGGADRSSRARCAMPAPVQRRFSAASTSRSRRSTSASARARAPSPRIAARRRSSVPPTTRTRRRRARSRDSRSDRGGHRRDRQRRSCAGF